MTRSIDATLSRRKARARNLFSPRLAGLLAYGSSAPSQLEISMRQLAPASGQAHDEPRQDGERAEGAQGQEHAHERLAHGPLARQRLAAGPARVDIHRGRREHEDEG